MSALHDLGFERTSTVTADGRTAVNYWTLSFLKFRFSHNAFSATSMLAIGFTFGRFPACFNSFGFFAFAMLFGIDLSVYKRHVPI
jgi:hypothetical protein